MSLRRVWAVFLRYFYLLTKFDQVCDLFYWPTIDILLWGITSVWIQKADPDFPQIAQAILTALVYWQILWRGNYEIAVNILQEFWNRNLVNMFGTPLKIWEWMAGVMLVGFAKTFVSLFFGALLVFLLYSINVFALGWAFLPFLGSILLSGWMVGFLASSLVIYFGQRLQTVGWMLAFVFAPFSAVFYPVSALPHWAQMIAKVLPMSYIFEGVRHVLREGTFASHECLMSYGLNAIYLVGSMLLFAWMYEKSRVKGLSRLE